MPYSRDVDAYPDMLKIAAIMNVNKDFTTAWMETEKARALRHRYYAFVRAHYATIERVNRQIDGIRLGAKHALSEERIAPARNLLILNRAREARLDVLKRFEVTVELNFDDLASNQARVRFRDKEVAHFDEGIDALFAQLAPEQKRSAEDLQFILESPAQAPSPKHIDDTMNALRSDPSTSFLFSMSIEEKIRTGIASREDFISCGLTPRAMYDMVLLVEDNEARNRMLGCLPPIEGIPINVLPPDSPFAAASAESAAQLDSAGAAPYAAQESKALALDEFLTTNGQSPEDFSNGNT